MSLPTHSTALAYESYGKANEVLSLKEIPLPPLQADQVLLKILSAPINPADMGKIGGSYGSLSALPAVGGMEGIAEIAATGDNVTTWNIGDRVIAPTALGSWQTYAVANAADIYRGPQEAEIEQAAMAWVNPMTAWKLLHAFATLKSGDWIIQNAATSGVGKLVIQFAHSLGIKTINLVRDHSQTEKLKSLGGTLVVIEDDASLKEAYATLDGDKPKLGLNAVGGSSAYRIIKNLADHSTLVTYGGMSRDLAPFPTRYLIFNDISLRGFWSNKYYNTAPREEIEPLLETIFQFMEVAGIKVDVAQTYPLSEFQAALTHANQGGKTGKVLFSMT